MTSTRAPPGDAANFEPHVSSVAGSASASAM
jgi:hypothetical protein